MTINSRHQDALRRASESGWRWTPCARMPRWNLWLWIFRQGIAAVGEIVGKTTTEDLLTPSSVSSVWGSNSKTPAPELARGGCWGFADYACRQKRNGSPKAGNQQKPGFDQNFTFQA